MSDNKNQLIILTAIGPKDRPGIIASLTRAVYDAGGNLDDATMTRLHGAFATMIAARVGQAALPSLRDRLSVVAKELDLHIAIEAIDETDRATGDHRCGPDHIISVYGADHPGIVHHVASMLHSHNVNITDLETRLTGDEGEPIYVMMVETSGGNWDDLPHQLAELGKELGVDVSFSEIDEETL